MSRQSIKRIQRRLLRKREEQVAVYDARCSVCRDVLTAKTVPLLRARLLEHYQRRHAHLLRAGAVPVLSSPARKDTPP